MLAVDLVMQNYNPVMVDKLVYNGMDEQQSVSCTDRVVDKGSMLPSKSSAAMVVEAEDKENSISGSNSHSADQSSAHIPMTVEARENVTRESSAATTPASLNASSTATPTGIVTLSDEAVGARGATVTCSPASASSSSEVVARAFVIGRPPGHHAGPNG